MEPDTVSSRRTFLRRMGLTLAAGLGVLAIPARAKATTGQCCPRDSCGPCTNTIPFYCDCGGPDSYCTCQYRAPSCYLAPC
jgi:hypothetical protein